MNICRLLGFTQDGKPQTWQNLESFLNLTGYQLTHAEMEIIMLISRTYTNAMYEYSDNKSAIQPFMSDDAKETEQQKRDDAARKAMGF